MHKDEMPHLPTTKKRQIKGVYPLALALLCLLWLTACDFRGIPDDLDPEEVDLGGSPGQPGRIICEPDTRSCVGFNVQVCSEDGRTLETEVCPGAQTCRQGTCAPTQETCEDNVALAISETFLLFERGEDLRPTTQDLKLTNCSEDELLIRSALIQTELREDGLPLFDFTRPGASPQGVKIPPGGTLRTSLKFNPRAFDWPELGTLSLEVDRAGRVEMRQVSLRSKTLCLSAPKTLFMGQTTQGLRTSIDASVFNCGNVPFYISAPNPTLPQREKAIWQVQGLERPSVLKPGEGQPFSVSYDPFFPGIWQAEIKYNLQTESDGPIVQTNTALATIHVGADAKGEPEPPCVEQTPPPVFVLGEQWSLSQGREFEVAPFSKQRIFFPQSAQKEGWFLRASLEAPAQSAPPLKLYSSSQTTFITPVSTGPHAISLTLYNPKGQPICNAPKGTLNVVPSQPLYIELQWVALTKKTAQTPQRLDPVREDAELGQGVDLDLHARVGERWRSPQDTCFTENPLYQNGPCELEGATVIHASPTGGIPEIQAFSQDFIDRHDTLDLGVWVKSKGVFERACAKVNIWHQGKLIATLPNTNDTNDTLCPNSRSLNQPQSFWSIGTLDLRTMTIDRSRRAVLPQIP